MKTRPTKYAIAQHWAKAFPQFVPDLGEPSCFACHFWLAEWDAGQTAKSCWTFARGLERCHIIAESLSGAAEPSNFLLLCADCHRESPMASDPKIMLTWAAQRESWVARVCRVSIDVLKHYPEHAKLANASQHERFLAFLREKNFDAHPASTPGDRIESLARMMMAFLDTTSEECFGL